MRMNKSQIDGDAEREGIALRNQRYLNSRKDNVKADIKEFDNSEQGLEAKWNYLLTRKQQ